MMYEDHIWDGTHDIQDCASKNTVYIAHDNARLHCADDAFVLARDGASVRVYGNSIVIACDNSNVTMLGDGCVFACDNAEVLLMGNGVVYATGESFIYTTVGKGRIFAGPDCEIVSRESGAKEDE